MELYETESDWQTRDQRVADTAQGLLEHYRRDPLGKQLPLTQSLDQLYRQYQHEHSNPAEQSTSALLAELAQAPHEVLAGIRQWNGRIADGLEMMKSGVQSAIEERAAGIVDTQRRRELFEQQ